MLRIPNPTKLFRTTVDAGQFYVLFCVPGNKNRITGHSPKKVATFDAAVELAEPLVNETQWALVFEKVKDRSQLARICDGIKRAHSRRTTKEALACLAGDEYTSAKTSFK